MVKYHKEDSTEGKGSHGEITYDVQNKMNVLIIVYISAEAVI